MPAAPHPPPLLTADGVTLAVSAEKDGKLRVVYGGWEDAKVLLPGEHVELWNVRGQVQAFRKGKPKLAK